MQKKILSILLTLCMLLGMFPFAILTGAAEAVTEDDFASEPIDIVVQGTADKTLDTRDRYGRIVIEDVADMVALSKDKTLWGGNYILSDDIDVLDLTDCGYTPIGTVSNFFTGTFDGNGKTVKVAVNGTTLLGLFSVAGGGAVIKNVTVTGSVTGTGADNAGLVGVGVGSLSVVNCVNKATITGDGVNNAGIIGRYRTDAASDRLIVKDVVNDGTITIGAGAQRYAGVIGYIVVTHSGLDADIINAVNNEAIGSESTKAPQSSAGVVAYINFGTGATNTDVQLEGCVNNGDVVSKGIQCGGIVGPILADGTSSGNKVTLKNCKNTGSITAGGNSGGINGFVLLQGSATKFSVNYENCINEGNVSLSAANAGGIVGYINYKSHSNAVEANNISLKNCVNTAKIHSTAGVCGGIIGRFDMIETKNTNASFTATDCVNTGEIASVVYNADGTAISTYKDRAGGFCAMFYQQKNTSYTVTVDGFYNSGAVTGQAAVGGVFGFYATKKSGVDVIKNCLNDGALTSTVTSARIGGIIGDGDGEKSSVATAAYTIENCYNNGTITATKATSAAGHLVGYLPRTGFTAANNVYYKDQTLTITSSAVGSAKTADAAYTDAFAAVTEADGSSVWGYANGKLFLADAHVCEAAATPTYESVDYKSHKAVCALCGEVFGDAIAHDEELPCVCGFEGCDHANAVTVTVPSTCQVAGTETVTCECGYTQETELELDPENHVNVGFKTIEYDADNAGLKFVYACCEAEAYDYSSEGKETVYVSTDAAFAGDDAYEFGSETAPFASFEDAFAFIDAAVMQSEELGSAVVSEIVVMGEYTLPADFTVPYVDGGITISGYDEDSTLVLENASANNVYTIYLDGEVTFQNLTFKTFDTKGIHLYAQNNDLTMGDGVKMVNPFEGYTDGNTLAGTKMYIFGGFNYTKLIAEQLGDISLADEFVTFEDASAYINETVKVPEISNTITVLSGEYHYVGGWHYNYDKYKASLYEVDENGEYVLDNDQQKVLKEYTFKYTTPTYGESTVIVGGAETPKFRHISAFECESASFGEGRTSNIYVNGNADIYELHLGAQVSAAAEGEDRYPAVVNLYLNGDITGENTANDDYGFNIAQNTDVAVLGNVYVNTALDTAIVDAHAVLGHDEAFCGDTECALVADPECLNNAFDYAYVVDGVCDCGGEEVVSGLEPTCSSFGMDRVTCASCGKLIRTSVVLNDEGKPYLNADNHVYAISLDTSYANISCYGESIKVAANCSDYCTGSVLMPFPADRVLYVKEGGSTEVADDLGTIDNPIGDFAIAHKLATAYSDSKDCEVTIKILDKATWTVVGGTDANGNTRYNDTYNRNSANNKGMVIIEGVTAEDGTKAELYFDNSEIATAGVTSANFRFYGAHTFRNLKITLANYGTYKEADSSFTNFQIHFYARNNKLVMDTGLEIEVSDYAAGNPDKYNFMVYGGFNATPGFAMDADLTVRSGNYRYIGGWNRASGSNVATGKAKLTVGATGEDTITTFFLNPYGINADVTDNTVVDFYIDGKVNASETHSLTQNNTAKGDRTVNFYFLEGADITNDSWDIKNSIPAAAGNYVVNVFVDTENAAAVADAHKLIGHDSETVHINANDEICKVEGCTTVSDNDSYSRFTTVTVTVNAYDYDNWIENNCDHVYVLEAVENGYAATCPTCGTTIATETNTVYLDQANGNDDNDGFTDTTALASLDEAMTLLSKVGGTVVLVTDYVQAGTSAVKLVATEAPITITSIEGDNTRALVAGGHGAGFILGGDMILENIVIDGTIAGLDAETIRIEDEEGNVTASYNTYTKGNYRTWNMVADWHSVTMRNVTVYGNVQLIAGLNRDAIAGADLDEKTVVFNIENVKQGTYKELYRYDVVDGELVSSAVVTNLNPFSNIMLGHRRGDIVGLELVDNKNVTLNIENTSVDHIWAASTSDTQNIDDNIQMGDNYSVTINAGEGTVIGRLFSGDANTGIQLSGDVFVEDIKEEGIDSATGLPTVKYVNYGNAYLNNLVINLTEDAKVNDLVALYNVRNLELSISDRTVANTLLGAGNEDFMFEIGLTKYYQDTYPEYVEDINVTYTTHSIANGKVPTYVGLATEEITENKTEVECTIEALEAVEPTCGKAGYTAGEVCTVCGVVYSGREEIPAVEHNYVYDYVMGNGFVCTYDCGKKIAHTHVIIPDGDGYECIAAGCRELVIPEGLVVATAGEGTVVVDTEGNKTVSVPVTLNGTLGGARFEVDCITDGVTINTEKTAEAVVDGWSIIFADDAKSAIIISVEGLDMAAADGETVEGLEDAAINDVVANFVFDVATDAEKAIVTVTTVEALTAELEYIGHVGIGAEISLVPHVCDFTKSYKTVVDENGKSTGKHVRTCECGAESEVAENCSSTGENVVVTPATCTEAGYTTYTCDFCEGVTIGAEIEATDHSYTYTDNEDGATHTVGCENCDYSAVADHDYTTGDAEDTCICGATKPVEHVCEYNVYKAVVDEDGKSTGKHVLSCACGEAAPDAEPVDCAPAEGAEGTVITAPTCTDTGITEYVCATCGTAYEVVTEVTDHSYTYTDNEDGATHTVGCENCDYSAVADHDYTTGDAEDTCICGATKPVEEPVYVAFIGEQGYESVQDALNAANVLDVIVISDEEAIEETVTPKVAVKIKGDVSKLTVEGDFVMDTISATSKVDPETIVTYVRPTTTVDANEAIQALGSSKVYGTTYLALESAIELVCGMDGTDANTLGIKEIYSIASIFTGKENERSFVLGTTPIQDGGWTYHVSSFPQVSSIEFAETITFVFYGIGADGTVYTYSRAASVAEYSLRIFNSATSEAEKKLMAAILNYGATAQLRFINNFEGEYVNAGLPAAYARTTFTDYINGGVRAPEKTRGNLGNDINILDSASQSLECMDEVILKVEFFMSNGNFAALDESVSFVATYTSRFDLDNDGEADIIEVVMPYGEWAEENIYPDPYAPTEATGVLFNVKGIVSADIRQSVSCALYRNYGTADQQQITNTRVYGAEEYASAKWADATEQAICAAVLDYCDAACGFFDVLD